MKAGFKEATVDIVYDDANRNKKLTVEVRASLVGDRMLNAINREVEKVMMNDDPDWTRWNLVSIKTEFD